MDVRQHLPGRYFILTMYKPSAQTQLREKLDYELWLLDFLSESQQAFEGGKSISTITLTNRQANLHRAIRDSDESGSGKAMKVKDAMSPLTFTASYKILDMIFEWILEENYAAGKIKDKKPPSQWPFSTKIDKIPKLQLIYPPLMQSKLYTKDYLFALYDNLLKFRNEIVHRNKFFVSDGKLIVTTATNGPSYTLELDRGELGAFVRIVVAAANLLTGNLSFGCWVDRLLKYHFDQIQKLHGLDKFKQAKPLLESVILKVPIEEGLFPVDLWFVRQKIGSIYPNADIQFNLKIIGLVNDKPQIGWFLPVDAVPKIDLLELRSDSLKEYRILLSERD